MTRLVTTAQMQALEAAAVAAGVSERELMANAGLAGAQEAWIAAGMMDERVVVVLVGPGKNGGDALVAATHLQEWGANVAVYLLRPRAEDDPEWMAVREAGIPATIASEDAEAGYAQLEDLLMRASLVLDGLFGTGFRPRERPIEGEAAQVLLRVRAARETVPPVQLISLDLPSGVDADTGFADPHTVRADMTVTFGFPKVGLYTLPGHTFAGQIVPIEIGIPPAAAEGLPYEDLQLRPLRDGIPRRPADGHKGTFGTVVIAAGSRRYPGAARLSAEAAARSGAGLVTIAAPEAIQALLTGLPDPTHEPLPSEPGHEGELDATAARALLRHLATSQARSLLVGPGIGLSDATRSFIQHLLAAVDVAGSLRAVVLDADALNVLAEETHWEHRITVPRVLTPHPGEMARLAGTTIDEVQANRLEVATSYAARTESIVVLKGACTVIAAPDGRARISGAATSALAHAGTGDVLAGLIAGFIAQGLEPFAAASVAVYLHADAARQVAEVYGDAATLASDLLRALPESRKLLDPPSPGAMSGPGPGPMGS